MTAIGIALPTAGWPAVYLGNAKLGDLEGKKGGKPAAPNTSVFLCRRALMLPQLLGMVNQYV
jgi:hypothetical protein